MCKYWRVFVLAVGLVTLAAGVLLGWPRPSRLTAENFDRIREGMTLAEVEALLGPCGDYRTGPTTCTGPYDPWSPWGRCPPAMFPTAMSAGFWICEWKSDSAEVTVLLKPPGDFQPWHLAPDEMPPGGVISAHWRDVTLQQGYLSNLMWRAERRWKRWFHQPRRRLGGSS